jgi:hypothetical protein
VILSLSVLAAPQTQNSKKIHFTSFHGEKPPATNIRYFEYYSYGCRKLWFLDGFLKAIANKFAPKSQYSLLIVNTFALKIALVEAILFSANLNL